MCLSPPSSWSILTDTNLRKYDKPFFCFYDFSSLYRFLYLKLEDPHRLTYFRLYVYSPLWLPSTTDRGSRPNTFGKDHRRVEVITPTMRKRPFKRNGLHLDPPCASVPFKIQSPSALFRLSSRTQKKNWQKSSYIRHTVSPHKTPLY